MIPKHWIPIYHIDCLDPAFYLERRPVAGDELFSIPILMSDGSPPERGEPARCSNCDELVTFSDLAIDLTG